MLQTNDCVDRTENILVQVDNSKFTPKTSSRPFLPQNLETSEQKVTENSFYLSKSSFTAPRFHPVKPANM